LWKRFARSHTCTVKLIIRIIHLIATEYGFQATLIKRLIMGYKGQSLNKWLYLFPYFWEYGGFFCVLTSKTMYLATPIIIVVGLWLNQRVESIHYLTITHYHYTH
jgi:hypothetical protein